MSKVCLHPCLQLHSWQWTSKVDGGYWLSSSTLLGKVLRVSMHVWRGGIPPFGRLCGESMEFDQRTIAKEVLTHGRVKVLSRKVRKLPIRIPLWLGDL